MLSIENENFEFRLFFLPFFAFSPLCSLLQVTLQISRRRRTEKKEQKQSWCVLSPSCSGGHPFATSLCTSRRCIDVYRACWSHNWTSHAHASAGCWGARGTMKAKGGESKGSSSRLAPLDRPLLFSPEARFQLVSPRLQSKEHVALAASMHAFNRNNS